MISIQKKVNFLLYEIYFIEQTKQSRPKNFWCHFFLNSFYFQGKDDWRYDTIDKFVQMKQEWSQWISQEFLWFCFWCCYFYKEVWKYQINWRASDKNHQRMQRKTDNSCGDNCKWIFDEKTKTLFIRGSSKMEDYEIDLRKEAPITP